MNAFARIVLASSTAAVLAAVGVGAEQESAQSLLERGAYAEAVQRVQQERDAGNNDPTASYLAGQAYLRLDQHQQAREEFARLSNGDDEAWKAIGQSAIALIDGAMDEAVNEGTRARDINGELGFAYYQLGLVQLRRSDWDGAAQVARPGRAADAGVRLCLLQRRRRAPAGASGSPRWPSTSGGSSSWRQTHRSGRWCRLALNALRG